jgi:hypothetical protein
MGAAAMSIATGVETPVVKIELDDGKYTYLLHADGRQHALRHGELWRDLVGDKFVCSLAGHAEELRAQNEKLVDALLSALPFVQDMEKSDAFKAGYVSKTLAGIREALTAAGVK